VQVHCDEDVASRIDPESCTGPREGVGEALTEECTSQPSSCERKVIPSADAVPHAEGNTMGRVSASVLSARRSHRTWHVQKVLVRKPGDLQLNHPQSQRGGSHREGEEP